MSKSRNTVHLDCANWTNDSCPADLGRAHLRIHKTTLRREASHLAAAARGSVSRTAPVAANSFSDGSSSTPAALYRDLQRQANVIFCKAGHRRFGTG